MRKILPQSFGNCREYIHSPSIFPKSLEHNFVSHRINKQLLCHVSVCTCDNVINVIKTKCYDGLLEAGAGRYMSSHCRPFHTVFGAAQLSC